MWHKRCKYVCNFVQVFRDFSPETDYAIQRPAQVSGLKSRYTGNSSAAIQRVFRELVHEMKVSIGNKFPMRRITDAPFAYIEHFEGTL